MTVTVSQSHFKSSAGYSSNEECPLALAIKSIMPPDTSVNVGGFTVYINNDRYTVPEEWTNIGPLKIIDMIDDAKNGLEVKEITLTLTEKWKEKLL
jgi:hypothetical protein